jgi:CRP-like cAMP-binding protein
MHDSHTDIEQTLRGLTIAAGWPERMLALFARLATRTHIPAGGTIFREGAPCDLIYFVVSGRVALEMDVPARGSVRLLTVSAGELLGWSPLLGAAEMTATAIAIEATDLLAVSGPALLNLCQQDHAVGFEVMRRVAWALSQRLTATRLQLLDLFSHTPPQFSEIAADQPR